MNQFSKEERVAFEKILEGFQDALVLSRNIARHDTDQTQMERTGDVIWVPQPYNVTSYEGRDMTGNFLPNHQLSVPLTISYERAVPWSMNPTELRDALQNDRLGQAAYQRLASDINVSVATVAKNQGSIVVVKSTAASGFADVAAIEGAMNRVGIADDARYLALSTYDYNGLANDLAGRQTLQGKALTAYERAYVGRVASFETYKLDYALSLARNATVGVTVDTRASASNYYTPVTYTTDVNGRRSNVDNRFQTITVSDNSGFVVGDAFTIAGVVEAHHVTRLSTGELKTFRVVEKLAANQIVITPPMIDPAIGGGRSAEQYQNVVITASATAALTFLNIVTKPANPFWHKEAIKLLPGRYAIPKNSGMAVITSSTDQGIEVAFSKQTDIKTLETFYRLDVRYGVEMVQPEMAGIALFSQA